MCEWRSAWLKEMASNSNQMFGSKDERKTLYRDWTCWFTTTRFRLGGLELIDTLSFSKNQNGSHFCVRNHLLLFVLFFSHLETENSENFRTWLTQPFLTVLPTWAKFCPELTVQTRQLQKWSSKLWEKLEPHATD